MCSTVARCDQRHKMRIYAHTEPLPPLTPPRSAFFHDQRRLVISGRVTDRCSKLNGWSLGVTKFRPCDAQMAISTLGAAAKNGATTRRHLLRRLFDIVTEDTQLAGHVMSGHASFDPH